MINYEQRFKINVFAYFEQFEGVSRVKVFAPALVHVRASFPIAGNISNSIHSHFHVKQAFQFQLYAGGVYSDHQCKNTPKALNHGVSVVGYGVGKFSFIILPI